jgi:hypothetical protein
MLVRSSLPDLINWGQINWGQSPILFIHKALEQLKKFSQDHGSGTPYVIPFE